MEIVDTLVTKTAWLGEFPAHWEVLRIKNLFQEMDSRSETGSEELLSVSHYTGVTLKRESLENEDDHITNAESLVGYKLVAKNDLVINIMLAWNGSLGISPFNGITSPAYCVYRIKEENNPEYFGYLFTTNLFKAEFRRNSTGIIDSRLRLYSDKLFSIFSVVPPKEEQDEIVQHIKEQSRKINQFIQKKKRFIELLKEQRQSIINHVVIKGINPSAKMKISGINWLGEVPQHWEVRRFGTLGEFSKGGNISRSDLAEIKTDFPAILYGDIYTKYDIKAETILNFISEETALNSTEIKSGDLLLTGSGETKIDIGKCIVYLGSEKVFVGGDVIIFKQTSFDSLFLSYSLNSDYSRMQKAISSKGDIIVHTYGSKLKNVILPIPPIEEQKHIVFHIKTQTANIDTTIAKTEREIGLIREYKEAMISEAVMGKRNINLQ